MKKIDAHAHIGEIGGWANVAATPQQLLELMDMYEIEKTVICSQNNEAVPGNQRMAGSFCWCCVC